MLIVRMMRALEYQGTDYNPLVRIRRNLQSDIGQEPHKIPSVFSFFKPEYIPPGLVGSAGFHSPESQVLNGPKSVTLMNTMISHIKYGMDDCYEGFGYDAGSCYIGRTQKNGENTYRQAPSDSAEDIVRELGTLLTSGRLDKIASDMVEDVYNEVLTSKDAHHALVSAQQLIALSPEFHSSGLIRRTGNDRHTATSSTPRGDEYKAVVNLMLLGGMDSMNMLVPAENCWYVNEEGNTTRDMYDSMRGVMALDWETEAGLKIDVNASSRLPQPCETFVIHPDLPYLHELYEQGDLAFFANTGVVNRAPLARNNYKLKSVTQLFAHNAMQDEGQAIDPFNDKIGTGILGRAKDVMTKLGLGVNSISIDNVAIATEGVPGAAKAASVVDKYSVKVFAPRSKTENPDKEEEQWFKVEELAAEINGETITNVTGIYGNTWSDVFANGMVESNMLYNAMKNVSLDGSPWYTSATPTSGKESFEDDIQKDHWYKWSTIFKLIETREARGVDRDVFFHGIGGWDHHSKLKENLSARFKGLNFGIEVFVKQLKQRGLWDNLVVVITSDFARTMTPNGGAGSDHAWGGNYIILGGGVKGKRIHGQYPFDLTYETGDLTTDGRGRYMPTTSWDACWNGVMEWLGIMDSNDLDYCLPNKDQTVDGIFKIFGKDDLFKDPSAGTSETGRGLRGGVQNE